ncbi:hypothetical protein AVEN_221170-1 [Araneus ventricosus]|uniref:Uncharacterized protein n=1 Tax=Araneus ventricosus TaxID=182803 RepID=A0A4Y2UMA8_ARAVE|nr:hypothetical protein AVEN_193663-1 [Araneus ventricosus]GBO12800.1 hypothetical protein AVEN_61257-1 [Araneus ventricosus]GBO12806.1 hypothetical protein AVEN_82552-1 [Araneus ventricosus]GBO12808.1 hypothetical protein AVEN_221170-1 [Araneus ventricosus]
MKGGRRQLFPPTFLNNGSLSAARLPAILPALRLLVKCLSTASKGAHLTWTIFAQTWLENTDNRGHWMPNLELILAKLTRYIKMVKGIPQTAPNYS